MGNKQAIYYRCNIESEKKKIIIDLVTIKAAITL